MDFLEQRQPSVKYYNDHRCSQRNKILVINSKESNLCNFSYLSSEELEGKMKNVYITISGFSTLIKKDFTHLIFHP